MKKILILKHVDIEGPGALGDFLDEQGVDYSLVDACFNDGQDLEKIHMENLGGLVILGGPMNVYEDEKYPFLKKEKSFLYQAIDSNIPVMGICLGAQLVAAVLGARVRRGPVKEIGWFDIFLTQEAKSDPLLKDFGKEIKVYQWHEDTFDLPSGAVLLAQANGMNQAFRYKDCVWGFQFHVEIDADMIKSWCQAYIREGKVDSVWREMVCDYERIEDSFYDQGRRIFAAFLKKIPV